MFGTPLILRLFEWIIFPGVPVGDIYLHPVARARLGRIAGHGAEPAAHRAARRRTRAVRIPGRADASILSRFFVRRWLVLDGQFFTSPIAGYMWLFWAVFCCSSACAIRRSSIRARWAARAPGWRVLALVDLHSVLHGCSDPHRGPVKISATIITYNEERNLPRAIESLRCADEIVVIDSGSNDRTVEIAEKLGARVVESPWPGYANQKNLSGGASVARLDSFARRR